MKLFIKNMVCNRCKTVVDSIITQAGLKPVSVELGEVELAGEPAPETLSAIGEQLAQHGFELVDDKKSRLIIRIKTLLLAIVYQPKDNPVKTNLSAYLSEQLHYEYNYISHLFSSVEGITIEQYLIRLKIERVKELLVYDEHTLNQIADELGYSSVAHLSAQFKKTTGLTPSYYKGLAHKKRDSIDQL